MTRNRQVKKDMKKTCPAFSKGIILKKSRNVTIISQREIEPFFTKAGELVSQYEAAMRCTAMIMDTAGYSAGVADNKNTFPFCRICKAAGSGAAKVQEEAAYPCADIHIKARAKVRREGVYIYTCGIGFGYWTSPIYAGSQYAGSLTAGQVLAIPREEAIARFCSRSGGMSEGPSEKPAEEQAREHLSRFPEKTHEEIQAMARMLLVCALKISGDPRKKTPMSWKKSTNAMTEEVKITAPGNCDEGTRDEAWPYFQERERMLLAALRRGDKGTAFAILDELLNIIKKTNPMNFDVIRLRSCELAVLLSRAAGGNRNPEGTYSRYFRRLRESENVEELNENLQYIIKCLGVKIFSFQGIRHASAIRKAERFIWMNYTRKISLDEIAAASGLSAPYFSTVFKEEMGKNLSAYLNELRVEKAAGLLTETVFSLSEIAEACGFQDQSWFSKIFKCHMGMCPGRFREQGSVKRPGEKFP